MFWRILKKMKRKTLIEKKIDLFSSKVNQDLNGI